MTSYDPLKGTDSCGHLRTTPDPPTMRAPGNAVPQAPAQMVSQQLVQWLTVQAGDMAGTLQHGVRTVFSPTSSPDVITPGQRRSNLEMKQTLQNQALVIETFKHKRQLAVQEAQSFAQRTRNNSEDFVRCELAAVYHFKASLQKEHDAQLRKNACATRRATGACYW